MLLRLAAAQQAGHHPVTLRASNPCWPRACPAVGGWEKRAPMVFDVKRKRWRLQIWVSSSRPPGASCSLHAHPLPMVAASLPASAVYLALTMAMMSACARPLSLRLPQGLAPGIHRFKYLVDGRWVIDLAAHTEADSRGNINNGVNCFIWRACLRLTGSQQFY